MTAKSGETPAVGVHAWSGMSAPGGPGFTYDTFSVGVFEWVPALTKRGMKRGPIKVRVRGSWNNPEAVYSKAREVAAALDAGTYRGAKRVMVAP